MKHGIERLDGHYVLGFGDGARLDPVRLAPNAAEEAEAYIAVSADAQGTRERISRVAKLIEGFESPYGLELLATVHWVATEEGASTPEQAIELTKAVERPKGKGHEARSLASRLGKARRRRMDRGNVARVSNPWSQGF